MTSYKHTFHPFCLGAMLYNSNKCCVCKQKLHLNWWASWGIRELDEDMQELVVDMHIDDLHRDMVVGVLEAAKCGLDLKFVIVSGNGILNLYMLRLLGS
jgi:hypothetical protein